MNTVPRKLVFLFFFVCTNLHAQTIFSKGGEWDYLIRFYDKGNNLTDSGNLELVVTTERTPIGQLNIYYNIRLKSTNYAPLTHNELALDKESLNAKYLHLIEKDIPIPGELQKPISADQLNPDSASIIIPKETQHFLDSLLSDPNVKLNTNPGIDSASSIHSVFTSTYFMIKPPRVGKLMFTQVAPFPFCDEKYFDKAKKDTLLGKDMEFVSNPAIFSGPVNTAYYYEGITPLKILNTTYNKCYFIHSISQSGLGKYTLDYYFSPDSGIVKMLYTLADDSKVIMELESQKTPLN